MSIPSLPRIQGSILQGRQRLRDHLVAAMRREPITWVGDETETDEDGPQADTPRWPQWGLLALVFIATLFLAAIPVAAESPTGPITIAPTPGPTEPQTEEPQTEEPQTEEPQTEEPQTEEPQTEEPQTEEPQTEEPGPLSCPQHQHPDPSGTECIDDVG
jgi:hypothetical protein